MTDQVEKSDTCKREEKILAFWNEKEIFKKSLEKPAPKGEFVFYDGPPFATGLPHYGHILAGTIKDVIPRYKTMKGYHVARRWGWDCHGLPLENQIEKELGLQTKRDIEHLGVKTFNEAARAAVLRYAEDWKKIIPRFGRWVDMENDYRSMDATYTESVWWAFNELNKKGFVYEGYKAMQLCPRCGTTLSNFEVAQGYKDITDLSVTVKLPLVDEPNTSLLAWTTTPWTLPGNMAAAVNPESTYVYIRVGDERYVLAKPRLSVIEVEYTIEKEIQGSELVGKSYTPPFPYFKDHAHSHIENAWKVYGAEFVTMEDGTGIVHIAPAFGADDLALAQKEHIPIIHHVDKEGHFIPEVTEFAGQLAKPKEDPQAADVAVIKYLAGEKLLFAKEKITHSYPHCWRCDTPLLNYATSSWFVSVPTFKDKLVAENNKIGWVPPEIGQNRFGDWLENARDWAISRSRYWGAPIPVWENRTTKEKHFVGSLEDMKKLTKKSGNTYFVMRHGQAESNIQKIVQSDINVPIALTEKGREDARHTAETLKSSGIDLIITSPFQRTRETAQIVANTIGLDAPHVLVDERLHELHHGVFSGRSIPEYDSLYNTRIETFSDAPEGGESFADVKRRMGNFIYDIEAKHSNKRILIISHGHPLSFLESAARGFSLNETFTALHSPNYLQPAASRELPFVPLPHNDDYELDYHRPYIDDVILVDEKGERLHRVPDVFDCWFESGSMAYAQNHYPFENKDVFDPKPGFLQKPRGYPADFIAEGLDQTRGWFYSLLVLGVALFGKAPFKHVIVNGIVLAEDGQKMSKRLQNYPDPLDVVEKYGADAVRYYVINSPLMRAQDLNFSEKGVAEVASKLIGRLVNTLSFYELYADATAASEKSTHVLDRWILSRLNQTIRAVEEGIEAYELDRAARPLMDFVDDLSTWYVRRSRDRFKEDGEDKKNALATMRFVLETLTKIAAPFIPFTAEYVYDHVKGDAAPESVHLAQWPTSVKEDEKLITEMNSAKELASQGLMLRQKANIKVRQPLNRLQVTGDRLQEKLIQILKDEINVKEITFGAEFLLDTNITSELREEGDVREVLRAVQDLRKEAGLNPGEKAALVVFAEGNARALLERASEQLKKAASLSIISFEQTEGKEIALSETKVTLLLKI